ncbi:hypothetical protein CI1B_58510 [Bradyrhizobium ivorense]|uniref:Uncharacterized protein n=1 Tax=Bradyrhizobium ivorense TaxID=2511166 RepID=A0A508TLY8_9BRAD|nr:hypothetical protein [Bradyrhizobium ivorense]VIO75349.1 hypothetical protein CI1B_58510 [Bradyrhizobium ivorense]
MVLKWVGPLALLAALVIGDQIRINRPGHKYRLSVEVETPDGIKSNSGVLAVHPDRGYSRGGHTRTAGDAVYVDLGGGKNLVALLAHLDKAIDLDDINYVALRAYGAARGDRVSFSAMSSQTGVVPVTGKLIPVLMTFADPADPGSARAVLPDDSEAALGPGVPAARAHRRSGAERLLAARFRRQARRTRHPRHQGPAALARRRQCARRRRAPCGWPARRREHRCRGRLRPKVTAFGAARADPGHRHRCCAGLQGGLCTDRQLIRRELEGMIVFAASQT